MSVVLDTGGAAMSGFGANYSSQIRSAGIPGLWCQLLEQVVVSAAVMVCVQKNS